MRPLGLVLFLALLAMPRAGIDSGVRHWSELDVEQQGGKEIRRVLKGSSVDFATMDVSAITTPPRAVFDDVVHPGLEELVIVKDGRLVGVVGERAVTLSPGSIAVVLPGERHSLMSAETATTAYLFRYRAARARSAATGTPAPASFVVHWDSVPFVPSDIGGRRQIADRPTGEFGRLEMHVSTLNGGLTNHPVHTHAAEEFVVVLRGSVRMVIGDTRQEAVPGDVIFLGSNVPHSLDNIGTTPAEYFAFQWMQP